MLSRPRSLASLVPRPELSPHRRTCWPSLGTPALCYIPLDERGRERNSVRAGISQDAPIPIDPDLGSGGRAVTAGTAEPSTDTPVVIPPGMLSGLSGQKSQARCMPQAASSLNPTVRHAVGVFLFQPCSAEIDGGGTISIYAGW
jgi:hypothetical protein